MLMALQSVAAYGYAQAHDIDKYVEVLVVYDDPTMVRSAETSQQIREEVEATSADLNADAKPRLSERIRPSTGRRTAPSSANNYGMTSLP